MCPPEEKENEDESTEELDGEAGQKKRSLMPQSKAKSMEERSSANLVPKKITRYSSLSQMRDIVSESFEEIVKVAEVTKPVMIMKAAMGTVTFKRGDNIKKEVAVQATEGKYVKEDLSVEHYNRLKVLRFPTQTNRFKVLTFPTQTYRL